MPGPHAFHLLAVDDDTRLPPWSEGMSESSARGLTLEPLPTGPELPTPATADDGDLAQQGWGLVVPSGGKGDRMLDAIAPLVRRRAEQQGRPVTCWRAPARPTRTEIHHWLDDRQAAEPPPHLLLVLGDLEDLALDLHGMLRPHAATGRLAFASLDHYRAYAEKVLRVEDLAPVRPRALLHTVHDRTPATWAAFRAAMLPAIRLLGEGRGPTSFGEPDVLELGGRGGCSPAELLAHARTDRPALLVTLANAVGPPAGGWTSAPRQRQLQGAMAFQGTGQISAADAARAPFLPGGLWWMMGSLGVATPSNSAFADWIAASGVEPALAHLRAAVTGRMQAPFAAALPQAALANPEGPLAVVGSADLAWASRSAAEAGGVAHHPARLVATWRALLGGQRAGAAMQELFRYFHEDNSELAAIASLARLDPEGPHAVQAARLWLVRQELATTLLLGDPAVRLGVAPTLAASPDPLPEPGASPLDVAGYYSTAAPRDLRARTGPVGSPALLPPAIERRETAIIGVLSGEMGLATAARRHGIEPAELERLVRLYREAGRRALLRASEER